jgi:hypothetical protein
MFAFRLTIAEISEWVMGIRTSPITKVDSVNELLKSNLSPQRCGRRGVREILLVLISTMAAMLLAEWAVRFYEPYSALGTGVELSWMRNNTNDLRKFFTIDPSFGFRPILGNAYYNQYGTKVNGYAITKKAGVERLLFIGDSVTGRAKIIDALKRSYAGGTEFEYWNAGVESFNTVQEVDYYQKYNRHIKPDHVILTFHLNDFETTPIAFYDSDRLVVYQLDVRPEEISRWWYKHSYLYRLFIAAKIAEGHIGRIAIARQVEEKLTELRDSLRADNIAFTVVILPLFIPYEAWPADARASRERILQVVKDLGVAYFDLLEPLNEAIKKGIIIQESEGDFWHPSQQVADVFAAFLHERRIFEKTEVGHR